MLLVHACPRTLAIISTCTLLGVSLTSQAAAQRSAGLGHVALLAGPVNYDLSGTGWSWGAAARADLPVARILSFESGITYFRYDTQGGTSVAYLFPELGAHLVLPTPKVRPYLVAGAGAALSIEGNAGTDVTVHLGLGLRTAGRGPYGARVEARFRNITVDSNASLFEVFFGVSRRW